MIRKTLNLKSTDVCLNIMPLFHIHGLSVNILVTALSGASVVCANDSMRMSPEAFFSRLAQVPQPTWYSAVPTMHQRILHHGEATYATERVEPCAATSSTRPLIHALHTIRNCSAALLPAVSERIESLFGCIVLPTYAMTESMPICSNPRFRKRKLGSVGLVAGPDVCIMMAPPEDCTPCEAGQEGHVCVRGACVTEGYEFRPAHMDKDPNLDAITR